MPEAEFDGDPTLRSALRALNDGHTEAPSRLWSLVYDRMRVLAGRYRLPERDLLHQTTDVVHTAFEVLRRQSQTCWQNEAHFFAIAALAMRRTVADWGRAVAREPTRTADDGHEPTTEDRHAATEILDLEAALRDLERRKPRCVRVVEMHYFAGLPFADIATELGVCERTVLGDWAFARAWLKQRLSK